MKWVCDPFWVNGRRWLLELNGREVGRVMRFNASGDRVEALLFAESLGVESWSGRYESYRDAAIALMERACEL